MGYSIWIGIKKTIKNGLIVMGPAAIAGYASFIAALPTEYQTAATAIFGFLGYFVKNWIQNK